MLSCEGIFEHLPSNMTRREAGSAQRHGRTAAAENGEGEEKAEKEKVVQGQGSAILSQRRSFDDHDGFGEAGSRDKMRWISQKSV